MKAVIAQGDWSNGKRLVVEGLPGEDVTSLAARAHKISRVWGWFPGWTPAVKVHRKAWEKS
jgi:hypothetical protein